MVLALVGAPSEGSLLAEGKPLRSSWLAPSPRPAAAHGGALGIVLLMPGVALAHSAGAKRAMLKGAIGRLVRPVAISSAISAPRPGPSWKPCPQKPNW